MEVEWRSSVRPIGHAKLDLGPNSAPVAFAIRLSGSPDGMAGDEERNEPMAGDESVRVDHDWAVKGHEE